MQTHELFFTTASIFMLIFIYCIAPQAACAATKTYVNSIGMEFIYIPSGSFLMGSPEVGDPDAKDNETPQHEVTISKSFYIGRYEVTQEEWKKVMGDNPSEFKGSRNPVENITRNQTREFIKRLNAMERTTQYRLPTEAEWEYAARAGLTTRYSFGDEAWKLKDYAWYKNNAGQRTHPVGERLANAWGLYDMQGNVSERVLDGKRRYFNKSVVDPIGETNGDFFKGCNFTNDYCRSANRTIGPIQGRPLPGYGPTTSVSSIDYGVKYGFYGFRLVRTVEE
jgi:formylglycine-generating enzyme required for sulfatase activity